MSQLYQDSLKIKIGEGVYSYLMSEAEKEIGFAMQMPLIDDNHEQKFYRPRFLLKEFLRECDLFESKGLKISPLDVVNILFRCNMLFRVKTEAEYRQRIGGGSYVDEIKFIVPWEERSCAVDVVVDHYFGRLEANLKERTLLTEISSFDSMPNENPQQFFDDLFRKMHVPFVAFFEGNHLVDLHKKFEPHLSLYTLEQARKFFCAPSIGFSVYGSEIYCYWYAMTWLRTFLNALRIAGYISSTQMDFGREVNIIAPVSSVFLGTHSSGCFCWDEDQKELWLRTPDGCLFLSFGYRGLAKIWLDSRTIGSIGNFMDDHKIIFENIKNPWNSRNINEIAPVLDILSTATQVQDIGAKILLIYCCLEHLFVPKSKTGDNKKYIIGGINALYPDFLVWFDDLYRLRCSYAHEGYVLKNNQSVGLVRKSIRNVMTLLTKKLSS